MIHARNYKYQVLFFKEFLTEILFIVFANWVKKKNIKLPGWYVSVVFFNSSLLRAGRYLSERELVLWRVNVCVCWQKFCFVVFSPKIIECKSWLCLVFKYF